MKLQRIVSNFKAITRNDTMEGRDYLVVPMVMLTEGVHSGSEGALYYPAEELAKIPAIWNHKPVVVYHPNGSACTPDVLSNRKIGVIMNTIFEDGKLKAEAWLEVSRIAIVDNRIMEAIDNNQMLELSTGLFTDNENVEGDWNGEHYNAIARNYRPDHLAVLPDQKGACAIEDGAGFLRLNKAGDALLFSLSSSDKQREYLNSCNLLPRLSKLIENEISFDDTRQRLYSIIQEKFSKEDVWIENVFDTYLIYERDGKLYKQEYEEKDNKLSFKGLPVEVTKQINYEPINNAERIIQMNKTELVNALIANEATEYMEDDRESLMAMNEKTLAKLTPVEKKAEKKEVIENKETKVEKKEVIDNKEEVIVEKKEEKPMTAKAYIANAPSEIQEVLTNGLDSFNAEKKRLVNTIVANKKSAFTEEELNAMNLNSLKKLAQIAAPEKQPRYDAQGDSLDLVDNTEEEPMDVPTMTFDK